MMTAEEWAAYQIKLEIQRVKYDERMARGLCISINQAWDFICNNKVSPDALAQGCGICQACGDEEEDRVGRCDGEAARRMGDCDYDE